jgi:UDP-N-acetylglucosamine transferase subunit ALG13
MTLTKPVFYLVNADGSGHIRRAEAILQHLNVPAVVATEAPERFNGLPARHQIRRLPPLRPAGNNTLADDVLHLPYGQRGEYLTRVFTVCQLCKEYRCAIALIDVCAETAMTMRLCGIPYVYMRMSGRRSDTAHLQCYQAAMGLLASYPEAFEEQWVPQWIRSKTQYVGGIFALESTDMTWQVSQKPYVLVMRGSGNSTLTPFEIKKAARFISQYYWIGIGFDESAKGENYQIHPRVNEPTSYLKQADIVVANTGNNSVLEAGMYSKPFITLPEVRFFDEQLAKANQLAKLNLAVVLKHWPATAFQWQDALRRAKQLDVGRWNSIIALNGAKQAASYVEHQLTGIGATAICADR